MDECRVGQLGFDVLPCNLEMTSVRDPRLSEALGGRREMTALQFDAGQIYSVVPADAAVTGRFVQHALGFVEAPDLQQDPCPVPAESGGSSDSGAALHRHCAEPRRTVCRISVR